MPPIARSLAARFVLLAPLAAFVSGIGCSTATDGPGAVDGANAGSIPADAGSTLPFDASMAPAEDGAAHVVDASPPILTATFLTIETSQYLSAPPSGAGPLVASGAPAGPNEAFVLTDLTGAVLTAGDEIHIATSADEVLTAADGEGGALDFAEVTPGPDETFIIVHVDGGLGAIESGDEVALQTKVTETTSLQSTVVAARCSRTRRGTAPGRPTPSLFRVEVARMQGRARTTRPSRHATGSSAS